MRSRRIIPVTILAMIAPLGIATLALAHIQALTIDRQVDLFVNNSVAHVTGLIQCTATEDASISVTILQTHGRELTLGSGFTNLVCDGMVQSWEVLAPVTSGSYQSGPATAVAQANTFGADGSDNQSVTAPVHLHK